MLSKLINTDRFTVSKKNVYLQNIVLIKKINLRLINCSITLNKTYKRTF